MSFHNLKDIIDAVGRPGIDPRHWVLDAIVADSEDSIEVTTEGCFVDVELAGFEQIEGDGYPEEPHEETAQWLFPVTGDGGVIYSKPRPGQPCILFVARGDPNEGIYATAAISTEDQPLPQVVVDNQDELHIVAPSGKSVVITANEVHLGEDNLTQLDGVVVGSGIDPFTGASYFALGNASGVVRAKK